MKIKILKMEQDSQNGNYMNPTPFKKVLQNLH